jgi:hypothetical protein
MEHDAPRVLQPESAKEVTGDGIKAREMKLGR